MYRPSYTLNDNPEHALKLIQDFPLGLLISHSGARLESSFLPFLAKIENQDLFLLTHLARSNPQWKHLGEEVLISFQGPNRYISPTMYKGKNNVPTWNYGLPKALQEKLESAIIGLKIKSVGFAKFKLSQNRNDEDYEGVLDFLRTSPTASDQELLRWMTRCPR